MPVEHLCSAAQWSHGPPGSKEVSGGMGEAGRRYSEYGHMHRVWGGGIEEERAA